MWGRIQSLLRGREQTRTALRAIRDQVDAGALEEAERLAVVSVADTFDALAEMLRIFENIAFERRDFALARAIGIMLQDAASAPRACELAQQLMERDLPSLARDVLLHALSLAPFDAVLRSEAALACARSASPQKAIEILALHPCLATDPAVLFQFAWSSLLVGDPATAEKSRRGLSSLGNTNGVRTFDAILRGALARHAALGCPPRYVDEYCFLTHGTLVAHANGNVDTFLDFLAQAYPNIPRRLIVDDATLGEPDRNSDWETIPVRAGAGLPSGFLLCANASLARVAPHLGPATIVCGLELDVAATRPWIMPHAVGDVRGLPSSQTPLECSRIHAIDLASESRRSLYHDAPLPWPARPVVWQSVANS